MHTPKEQGLKKGPKKVSAAIGWAKPNRKSNGSKWAAKARETVSMSSVVGEYTKYTGSVEDWFHGASSWLLQLVLLV